MLGSNQRRLSRRFYRLPPTTFLKGYDLRILGSGDIFDSICSVSVPRPTSRGQVARDLVTLATTRGPRFDIDMDPQAERSRQGEQGVHRGVVLSGFQPRHHRLPPAQSSPEGR